MERWFNPSAASSAPDLYSPLAGIAGGVSAYYDARSAARAEAAKQADEAAKRAIEKRKADLYGQQIEAQVGNQKRQDRRDQLKFQVDEAKRRGEVTRDIGKAFGANLPGQAQSIASASQFEGPNGELQGVQLSRVPNPVAAPAPVVKPQAPEFVGPLETPEDARARAVFEGLNPRNPDEEAAKILGQAPSEEQGASALQAGDAAASEVERQQAARDKFGVDQREFPARSIQAYHQQQEHNRNEANPQYKVSFPGGGSDVIDPREARAAAAAEAKDRADRLRTAAAAPGQAPDVAASMMRQADLIESQISNADKAPITNMASTVQSQGFKSGEATKDRQLKRELKAKGVGKGLGGPQPGTNEYHKEEVQLEGELKDYETKANLGGPKGLRDSQRELTDAYTAASAEDQNPARQLQILDRLIRSGTGLGVRQQMLDTYISHLGGLMEQGEGKAQQWLNGQLGQSQWANVKDALRQAVAESQGAGGAENQRFHNAYDSSPMARRHQDLLRRHESAMFSGLHGYGAQPGQQPNANPAQGGGKTTTVHMPDGTVQEFDSSGKMVK